MYQADVIFSPMMPTSSRAAKIRRPAVTGSLNKMMPTITEPSAPMPVQTAYAVPSGSVFVARQQVKTHRHAGEREQRPAELCESLRILHAGRPNDLKNSGNTEHNPCHIDYLHIKIKNAPARVFNGLQRETNAPVPARRRERGQDTKNNIFCQAAELR